MIKWPLLNSIFAIADLVGLNILFRSLNSHKLRILMYHGVTSKKLPTFYWTQLSLDKFIQQMDYIKEKYNAVNPAYLTGDGDDEIAYVKNATIITFDDGFENVYAEAWPVLRKGRLPAVCFVVPALSENNEMLWTDRLYVIMLCTIENEIDLTAFGLGRCTLGSIKNRAKLANDIKTCLKSWPHDRRTELLNYMEMRHPPTSNELCEIFRLMAPKQIAELSKSGGFIIASHSNSHPILSTMSREEQDEEINSSLGLLAKWGVPTTKLFAYPNGRLEDFNESTIEVLQKHQIVAAVTTIDGHHSPDRGSFFIRRIPIGADMNRWEFKARMSGFYYFLLKLLGKSDD
jgi:peptidoglycan/xylan/chitin deacetylase (PgdA/CDA1 family)